MSAKAFDFWKTARARFSKFSPAFGLRDIVFHLSIMLPSQFKRLIEAIRSLGDSLHPELREIKDAANKHVIALYETANNREKKEEEIAAGMAEAMRKSADTVPQYERDQRKKEHNLQWGILWVTVFGSLAAAAAALGAFYYARIANRQLSEMRQANQLAQNALDINTKALIATQAAVFNCQSHLDMGDSNRFIVECRNQGQIPARNLTANINFVRTQDGRKAQHAAWSIERPFILKNDEFAFIIPVPAGGGNSQQLLDWVVRQKMEGKISFTYNNGVESVSEQHCWNLIAQQKERSWSVTDCDNAKAINSAKK